MLDGVITQIERTKRRKTIGFEVRPGSIVRILVPDTIDDAYIEDVLKKRSLWIYEQVEEANKILISARIKEYISGESFSLLGKEYRLKIVKGISAPVILKDNYLVVFIPKTARVRDQEEDVKDQILMFYKKEAGKKIEDIAKRFSSKLGVVPRLVSTKDYKSSWGMCTKNQEIYINWRVIMAPITVVNYVVVHELCHLIYPNHSKQFWSLVHSQILDVQYCKDWLKYNQLALKV